jgi:hypothetical protein
MARWLVTLALLLLPSARSSLAQEYGAYEEAGEEQLPDEVAEFYDTLSQHGTWFQLRRYGWVWQPSVEEVGTDFVPYTNGRWQLTDVGWTWVSGYPWGWAAFHYGRWFLHPRYGWLWKPGTEWAPAWVEWRAGDGYVGWAPMAPDWYGTLPEDYGWSVVAEPYFVAADLHRRLFHGRDFARFRALEPLRERREIGGARVPVGPPPSQIAARVGRPIPPQPIARLQQQTKLWSPRMAPTVQGRTLAPAQHARAPLPPRSAAPGRPQALPNVAAPPHAPAPQATTPSRAPGEATAHGRAPGVAPAPSSQPAAQHPSSPPSTPQPAAPPPSGRSGASPNAPAPTPRPGAPPPSHTGAYPSAPPHVGAPPPPSRPAAPPPAAHPAAPPPHEAAPPPRSHTGAYPSGTPHVAAPPPPPRPAPAPPHEAAPPPHVAAPPPTPRPAAPPPHEATPPPPHVAAPPPPPRPAARPPHEAAPPPPPHLAAPPPAPHPAAPPPPPAPHPAAAPPPHPAGPPQEHGRDRR